MNDERRLIVYLFLVVLAVRVMALAGTYTFGTDSAAFLRMAELMREGSWHAALKTGYHPGYPAAIAAVSLLTGNLVGAGFLVSLLFGSLAALPLYLLARDSFGRPAALITVALYAMHYPLVDLHTDVMTEGLFCAALFTSLWMGRRFIDAPRLPWALGAGLAAAGAYMVRHEGLIALCGLACWFLFEAARRRNRSSGDLVLGAAFLVGTFFVASMPFLIWVRGEMGRWATTAKGSGIPLQKAMEGEVVAYRGDLTSKALIAFVRLNYIVLLVPLAAGLALAWRQEKWRRLYLLSWAVAYYVGVAYTMQGMGYVSYRYLLPGFCILLPFIAWGVLELIRLRPMGPPHRAAAIATLVLCAIVGYRDFDVHRWEDLPLVRAGEWIREHAQGRPRILSTRDKVAWFAKGDLGPPPATVDEAAAADFLVFTRQDFVRREWACMPELERDARFER
ncbi:MAG TPA: glycosyltransferase family 39 protein, partial [Planctomycetota bacterium]|nr:glycosyltransferase family 39 protein [Planctomycetota bacterium]